MRHWERADRVWSCIEMEGPAALDMRRANPARITLFPPSVLIWISEAGASHDDELLG
jgi:hypothetical protein